MSCCNEVLWVKCRRCKCRACAECSGGDWCEGLWYCTGCYPKALERYKAKPENQVEHLERRNRELKDLLLRHDIDYELSSDEDEWDVHWRKIEIESEAWRLENPERAKELDKEVEKLFSSSAKEHNKDSDIEENVEGSLPEQKI